MTAGNNPRNSPRPDAEDVNATVPAKGWDNAATIPAAKPAPGSGVNMDATVPANFNVPQPTQSNQADRTGTTSSQTGDAPTLLATPAPSPRDAETLPATRATAVMGDQNSAPPVSTAGFNNSSALSSSFSRTGRTRINSNLPSDTQRLDQKLQMSRTSVLSDMATARIAKGEGDEIPSGIKRLIDAQGTEGRYAVDRPLAAGGMGAVLQINDHDFRRPAAMKVILSKFTKSPEATERFLAEAQVTAQLEHPNIVPIHDLGVMDDGTLYFTMKLIEGMSLGRLVKLLQQQSGTLKDKSGNVIPSDADSAAAAKKWNETELLLTFLKVLEGVGFAHSRGVVHRDLKPDNVMLGAYGEVLVVDWGIAKVLGSADRKSELVQRIASVRDQDSVSATMDGSAMGTLYYMPPEQALGKLDDIDARSDIYALGAMLYELLSLRRYIDGGSMPDIIALIATNAYTPLDRVVPHLAQDLVAIVHRALALERHNRYQNCIEFTEDIRRYLAGQAVLARRANLLERLGRWYAKHRMPVNVGVGAVALTVCVIVGTIKVQQQQNLSKAEALRVEAQTTYDQALAQRDVTGIDKAYEFAVRSFQLIESPRTSELRGVIEQSSKRLKADLAAEQKTRIEQQAAAGRALMLLAEAQQFQAANDLEKAEKTLDAAIRLAPDNQAITNLLKQVATARADKKRQEALVAGQKLKIIGDEYLTRARALHLANEQVDPLLKQADEAYTKAVVDVPIPGVQEQAQAVAVLRKDAELARIHLADQIKGQQAAERAQQAFASGKYVEAKEAIAQALGFIPNQLSFVQFRDKILADERVAINAREATERRAQALEQAQAAMTEANQHMVTLQAAVTRLQESDRTTSRLNAELTGQPAAKKEALWQAYRVQQDARSAVSEAWSLAEASAQNTIAFLVAERAQPIVQQARLLLSNLYQARLTDARQRRDFANVAAFANLLARYDDGRYQDLLKDLGRLQITGKAGTRLALRQVSEGKDLRIVPTGETTTITLPAEPLSLVGGRYQLTLDNVMITVVVGAQTPVAIAWPEKLPQIPNVPLRYVPAVGKQKAFLLGQFEITHAQYFEFVTDKIIWQQAQASWADYFAATDLATAAPLKYFPREGGYPKTWQSEASDEAGTKLVSMAVPKEIKNHPIWGISRDDAEAYCAWLSKKIGLPIRLPLAAEWQFAAHGGDDRRAFPWGEVFDEGFAVTIYGSERVRRESAEAIGSAPADTGPFGHQDLAGNVREWLADRSGAFSCIMAGGGWSGDRSESFRTMFIESVDSRYTGPVIGFRILVDLP